MDKQREKLESGMETGEIYQIITAWFDKTPLLVEPYKQGNISVTIMLDDYAYILREIPSEAVCSHVSEKW